jgi:hypothetical protein
MTRQSTWMLGAALVSGFAASASAQTQTPPDPGAAANVRQSQQQYEQILHSNPAFRSKRMQQECGPITDPQLHESCVASFGGGAPAPARRRQP